MRFITAAAIKNRSVTMLAVVILLAAGVFSYNSLQIELFPEIEFPLVVVSTAYPAVDPEGVVRDVTGNYVGECRGTLAGAFRSWDMADAYGASEGLNCLLKGRIDTLVLFQFRL